MNQPIFKNVCVGFREGVEAVNKFLTKFTRKKELPCPKMEGAPSHHYGLIVDQVGSVICAGWIRGVMGVGGT